MGWKDTAERLFPDAPRRANRPNVPIATKNDPIGLIGTLARHTVSENHDAHVIDFYDFQERWAIMEIDGEADRDTAKVLALADWKRHRRR